MSASRVCSGGASTSSGRLSAPSQPALAVDHEDRRQRRVAGLLLADAHERPGRVERAGQGDDVGRHERPGRVLGVTRQAAQRQREVGRQAGEDLFDDLVGQVGQHVGGVVGLDVPDDRRGALARHLDQRRRGELFVHLFEGVGGQRRVQGGQHGGALTGADLADDVGEVGGVQLGDLGEGVDEVGLREAHRDEVDVGPGHEVAGARRQAARQKAEPHAPHDGAARGVDAAHHEARRRRPAARRPARA